MQVIKFLSRPGFIDQSPAGLFLFRLSDSELFIYSPGLLFSIS